MDPRSDSLAHILTIQIEIDMAGTRERFQPFDHRRKLHSVVSGYGLSAEQFFLVFARAQ